MSQRLSREAGDASIANFHFEQARLAAKLNNKKLFKYHIVSAIHQAPSEWEFFEITGRALFELNELNYAFKALQKADQNSTLGSLGAKILAALYHEAGQEKEARHYMGQFANLSGIKSPMGSNQKLTNILEIRSAEKSHFKIKRKEETGLLYCQLSGGHFSTTHLIEKKDFNIYQVTCFNNSLRAIHSMPKFSALINSISCPDLDEKGLKQVNEFIDQFPQLPVINHPRLVLQTTRAKNSKRFSAIPNVNMPRAELFEVKEDLESLVNDVEAAGFSYPFIVRLKGTQTGISVALINTRIELKDWAKAHKTSTMIYIIDYINCKSKDGLYNRTRVFFIDGQLYPISHLTSDQWQIHSNDRYRVMNTGESFQKEESNFLNNPEKTLGEKAIQALYAVNDKVGLDFFGIDFALDNQNNVVIFEVNAAMRHNFDHANNFPYTRFHLDRASAAFTSMIKRKTDASLTETLIKPRFEPKINFIPMNDIAPRESTKNSDYFDSIAHSLIQKIRNPPYWLVLRNEQNHLRLEDLMRTLFSMGMHEKPANQSPPKLSITRIEIEAKEYSKKSNVTSYSRTSKALPLHTDCSNQWEPLNLVAFAMESPDRDGGGKSTILTAADLAKELPDTMIEQLIKPNFNFGGGKPFRILENIKGDWKIRYSRNQIDLQSNAGGVVESRNKMFDQLDHFLMYSTAVKQFSLAAGDILLIDNRRVLHGRTAISPMSSRLMHRFRLHAPSLD